MIHRLLTRAFGRVAQGRRPCWGAGEAGGQGAAALFVLTRWPGPTPAKGRIKKMKTSACLFSLAVVTLLGVAGSASAQQPKIAPTAAAAAAARPAVTQFLTTRVTGVIRTTGTAPGEASLNGYNCDDLDVIVSSKESSSTASFAPPKWVRTRHAVGTWSSGQCTFSVPVVANSEFNVYVSAGTKDYPCQYIGNLVVSPGYSAWTKVAFGKSVAVPDFTMSAQGGKFYCGMIY